MHKYEVRSSTWGLTIEYGSSQKAAMNRVLRDKLGLFDNPSEAKMTELRREHDMRARKAAV